MEKKKTIKLYFDRPVDKDVPINMDGGQFGAPRNKGRRPHKGLDFKAYLKPVYASERGIVVYSGTREGSISETNYGETIVIDHTPAIPDDERHIYTLYAHLDKKSAYRGQKVEKGDTVGISGNSGTVAYYKKLNQSFHLHFEVIDSPTEIDWSYGWHSGNRKDPTDYLGGVTTIEYDLGDMVEKSVYSRGHLI
ncbi:MAG: M23 family metallopeptidase [Deltaproteobacteria bacterium]|nr:M23 family metallopeptidase [Deltaproteobacteria bacterium]